MDLSPHGLLSCLSWAVLTSRTPQAFAGAAEEWHHSSSDSDDGRLSTCVPQLIEACDVAF